MNNEMTRTNMIIERARIRRGLKRQRTFFRFASALLIAMTIATFTLSIRSFASEKDADKPHYKYYTSYTIDQGENLNTLARRYMTKEYSSKDSYISEVVSINHLVSASDIYAGQVIILPYYSADIK